jgi:methyl-accepting chemotaxis protein
MKSVKIVLEKADIIKKTIDDISLDLTDLLRLKQQQQQQLNIKKTLKDMKSTIEDISGNAHDIGNKAFDLVIDANNARSALSEYDEVEGAYKYTTLMYNHIADLVDMINRLNNDTNEIEMNKILTLSKTIMSEATMVIKMWTSVSASMPAGGRRKRTHRKRKHTHRKRNRRRTHRR